MITETVRPNLEYFIESLREIGYSTEVAIADLIDNSVTADSTEIRIYATKSPKPCFALLDNGNGMDENSLIEAMRLASKSPAKIRNKNDLGRFGLGLKTASFSQCKKLTVITKRNTKIYSRQWDLNYIAEQGDWLLIKPKIHDSFLYYNELEKLESGTLVIWEEIDKIPITSFSEVIDKVRKHLSLVFHKFLEGQPGLKKINIIVNNNLVKPFNPFNTSHPATQQIASEKINIFGASILIQPFILPHPSKVSQQEYELYATEEGYIKSQGFYLYRENRIIIYGTWWGLHKATDNQKLIRIKIEIPNSMDSQWGIDVKKSIARPAEGIKSDLKRIISQIAIKGSRPFLARGKKIDDKKLIQFWEIFHIVDKFRFAINKEHPLYIRLISSLNEEQIKVLNYYLKCLQAYLPLDAIQLRLQMQPHSIIQDSILTETDIREIFDILCASNINYEYKAQLLKTEIFKNHKELFKS